jgi:hypothetical protein
VLRVDAKDEGARAAATDLLTDASGEVRLAAAALLGDERSLALAALPQWLAELRGADPERRALAARRLDGAAVAAPELTGALVRAVDRRDMAARQGLIAAVEQSVASGRPFREVLDATAAARDGDPAARAYARAALRELAAAAAIDGK